ncbi:hypothetical protein ACLOJK_033587 [Asimina triloba]
MAAAVFEKGSFTATIFDAPASASPPKPLLIASPTEEGEYSVLVLFHGFLLHNTYYRELLKHVASHGYILVAPQLYWVCSSNEIEDACAVLSWLSQGLQSSLPTNVKANTLNLALAGHSRGGRAAFLIALGKAANTPAISIKLLIGIDPVAGSSANMQLPPPILTFQPRSFDLQGTPVMVIGTGLGSEKKNCLFPACAPAGVNHQEFYNECQPPCFHLVATDYGHMDMLDDPTGIIQKMGYCMCVCGKNTEAMRRFVGGMMVAFLQAYLDDDQTDNDHLKAILSDPSIAPVKVDPIEYIEKEEAKKAKFEAVMPQYPARPKTMQLI